MLINTNNLFSDKEWIGEFFLPHNYEHRFFGEISYSPERGLVLSYHISSVLKFGLINSLHGVLETGQKCTLFCDFSLISSGQKNINGMFTRWGKVGVPFLILGEHICKTDLFEHVSFSLTGMQEFFYPKGFTDRIEISNEPLFEINTDILDIKIVNNVSFGHIGENITTQVYSENQEALGELKKSYEDIDKKYENSSFMLKKDIVYRVSLKTKQLCSIEDLYKHIMDFSNLLAILIHNPIYPEIIELTIEKERKNPIFCEVYPSIILEKRTVNLCKKMHSHFHLPISVDADIDLCKVISNWLVNPSIFPIVVSRIQHMTGFSNEHALQGDLLLNVTQLESISYSTEKNKTDRYTYPIEKYASNEIKEILTNIFSNAGQNDYGKGISELRNEIAHINKPKKLLLILSTKDLLNVCKCIEVVILSYILETLGVSKDAIRGYQYRITQY